MNFYGNRYVNTALGLCVAMESCIKQNNAIEIYEVMISQKLNHLNFYSLALKPIQISLRNELSDFPSVDLY